MALTENDKSQAVMFIGKEGVVKELLYPEFQAVLDGFVPMEEWANRTAKAVYLEFNSEFCVTAAVFFTLSFEPDGMVERSWNLPLLDLARTSAKGPDMGAGPIHLVCASQCPVALFKDFMWDPDLKPQSSHLIQIKKSLKRNKMGIHFKPVDQSTQGFGELPADVAKKMQQLSKSMGEQYQKELRDQVAQMIKDQRLQTATMSSEKEKAVNAVRLEFIKKIEALQQQLETRSQELLDAKKRNSELKETIEGQVQKIEGLREYFEKKLERTQAGDEAQARAAQQFSEEEVSSKVEEAVRETKELLKMKEVELIYHTEHEEALQVELELLREEKQELLENGGDHLLEKLSRKGVNFVTYQPGAGHITIPLSQISLFLDSPVVFTADYCGVSEKHYSAWLQHYQAPVCMAETANGELCGANLDRVASPTEFVDGESNFCLSHNQLKNAGAVER